MKNILIVFLLIILWSGCVVDSDLLNKTLSVEPKTIELAEQNNEFGFDILKKLYFNEPDSNIFISPMSISTALAMTLNGAEGETKTQILETMKLNEWDIQEINESFKNLLSILPNFDENVKLKIANSIWYNPSITVYDDFLNTNKNYYFSEVNKTNVSKENLDKINNWCKNKTDGLIEEVIENFPPDFLMFLINAIYFKGSWTQEFDSKNTYDDSFFLSDVSNTPVKMMDYKGKVLIPYFENDIFQAVDLAYGNGDFSMSIFLPKNNNYSVDTILSMVNSENWNAWVNSFEKDSIFLKMPKFKLEFKKKLKNILKELGMIAPFESSNECSFSKMTNRCDAKISEVYHQSFLEVNEKGTEAAAVTVVEVVVESIPEEPVFTANKPFVFFIRNNKTNSILFSGVLNRP